MTQCIKWLCILFFFGACSVGCTSTGWKKDLSEELPLMGHRNWVVVADSAYPLQTSPGIKTVYAGGDHVEVLRTVLHMIEQQKHVRPIVFMDHELDYVDEAYAPGINTLRSQLNATLAGANVQTLPHEDIIKQLDEAGEAFHIVLVKTGLTLPYTSVFIRLDCGYWSDEAQNELMKALPKENSHEQ